ncbi:MAG: ABC transporter permease [Chloroflexi bacterium]|nr:ABC transporter permease [Chloroflexota bacterium]
MFLRLLKDALWRRKGRAAITLLCVVAGLTLAVALLSIAADVSEKMSRELRSYGANVALIPQSEEVTLEIGGVNYTPPSEAHYIDERELVKVKTIFWRNNILGLAPFLGSPVFLGPERRLVVLTGTWFDKELTLPVGATIRSTFAEQIKIREAIAFRAGVKSVAPWWKVTGQWPEEASLDTALVGATLARREGLRLGDILPLEYEGRRAQLRVVGLLTTGGLEDDQVIVPLPVAQRLLGLTYGVNRVMVSATVLPKEKLASDIRYKRPEDMTPKEYEKWYCSPVVEAVAKQLEEAIPGSQAQPILQVAQAEGAFLLKLEWLMVLITFFALLASSLGVMATVNTTVLERRKEIGLMKALGASNSQVAALFLAETGIIALLGGSLGFGLGAFLARILGEGVFGLAIATDLSLFLVALLLALAVSLVGSGLPLRQISRLEPVGLLRGQ